VSSLPERTYYSIYDRWGNELFTGRSTECWDPESLGQKFPLGVLSLKTFTKLPSNGLDIQEFTIIALP